MSFGLNRRLQNLQVGNTGKYFIFPIDHPLAQGVGNNIVHPNEFLPKIQGKSAIMVRPGMLKRIDPILLKGVGIIACLTGKLDEGVDHLKINSVEHAIAFGADAINVEFKFGSDEDLENVRICSELIEEAHKYDMPVLVTVYCRPKALEKYGTEAYSYAIRICEELGGDIVKTSIPNTSDLIEKCVSNSNIPIILAGGEKMDSKKVIQNTKEYLEQGVAGVAYGRNLFESDEPTKLSFTINEMIINGY